MLLNRIPQAKFSLNLFSNLEGLQASLQTKRGSCLIKVGNSCILLPKSYSTLILPCCLVVFLRFSAYIFFFRVIFSSQSKASSKKTLIFMAMLTLEAASENNITKALQFRHSSNLCDASFSSYLNGAEETFMHKLAEASKTSRSLIPHPYEQFHHVSKKADDNEIDIFSADKYFNGGVDDQSPQISSKTSLKFSQKTDPPPELDPLKQHHRSSTPSVRSESSWSSQKALLKNADPQNQQQPQKTNKANHHRRSFLANFGCHCTCGDKNSVDIDVPIVENISNRSINGRAAHETPKRSPRDVDLISLNESRSNNTWIREESYSIKLDRLGIGLAKDGHFRFPVSNPSTKIGGNVLEMPGKQGEDETMRKSLEVFGSPIHKIREDSVNMLAWDALVTKVGATEQSKNSRKLFNDSDSDASSDLFEIESFSTNPSQHLTRQASDGMSSAFTQTTCYAPSEASIEWSVVTASAADFSVMSDTEELRANTTKGYHSSKSQIGRSTTGREMLKRRSGILSGCYSEKAVMVAGDVYRSCEKASPGRHQKP